MVLTPHLEQDQETLGENITDQTCHKPESINNINMSTSNTLNNSPFNPLTKITLTITFG